MSEEQYWVLTGEGEEESESPSLSTCASSVLLIGWVVGSSRGVWVEAPELQGSG